MAELSATDSIRDREPAAAVLPRRGPFGRLAGLSLAGGAGDLFPLAALLLPMTLAAAIVAAPLYFSNLPAHWRWQHWLIVSPVLYLCWLLVFLLASALTCRQLGARYPKPRRAMVGANDRAVSKQDRLGLLTALVCYRRLGVIRSLPLVWMLEQLEWLRLLVFRAYSPAVRVGRALVTYGCLYDPDLTEIGNNVVIGAEAVVSAHSMTVRKDGTITFVSAPVQIGDGVTIGGAARIDLGCVIGDDAIVEPGSVVVPFTRIGPGEIWGGNPAAFRRRRDVPAAPEAAYSCPTAREAAATNQLALGGVAGVAGVTDGRVLTRPSAQELRDLVVDALNLGPEAVRADLSSDTCASWDSLGQLAIAAALFDRYGVAIDAAEVFHLRALQDVADIVDGGKPAANEAGTDVTGGARNARGVRAGTSLSDDLLPLLDPREATQALAARFRRATATGQPLRVVVAASFTAQALAPALTVWGRAFGFDVDCAFAGHDQIVQALLDGGGPFATNRDGVNVVLTRPEDFAADSPDQTDARLDQVLDAVAQFAAQKAGGQLLVGTLPPVISAFSTLETAHAEALRHRWRSRLDVIVGVDLFEFARVVERLGADAARDSQAEVLLREPYTPRLYQDLGIALVRQIRARRTAPAKVIAVDCDNTLWGGVLGEVGIEGIQLGPDGTGRAFQLFQRVLKRLKDRGLLLAVVSKNEGPEVLDVFANHPEMVLRPDDIVAWRVNWNHKSQSLREIAGDLNLGLDSFVFMDDDPAVRMEVRTRLPDVHVIPLPANPADFCDTLARLWLFDGAEATEVDAARTRMMQEEGRRQRERTAAVSLEDYLAALELHVDVAPPAAQEWPRVAQLTHRTNQFNLSLKRRTVEELTALGAQALVLTLKARDRFGAYGLTGVCILRPAEQSQVWEIDTLLMSCRVLGRGVEDAFLHAIAAVAAQQGAGALVAPYQKGPRNGQVLDFLARTGFTETSPSHWYRSLDDIPPVPAHVDLHLTACRVAAVA